MTDLPNLEEIAATHAKLGEKVIETPVLKWNAPNKDMHLGASGQVHLKLEAFQTAGWRCQKEAG